MRTLISALLISWTPCIFAQPDPVTIDAGPDTQIQFGETGVLNGSEKYDGKLEFTWRQVDGPSQSRIVNPNRIRTKVDELQVGTYEFELTAYTNKIIRGTDRVRITVYDDKKNQLPVARAGGNQSVTVGQELMQIKGEAYDPDGKEVKTDWSQVSGKKLDIEENGLTLSIPRYDAGVFEFELYVVDNKGGEDRDTVRVTITDTKPNRPPVVNAGPPQTITLPDNRVTLSGTADDRDGKIVSVKWRRASGPGRFEIANDTARTTEVSRLIAGEYRFEFTATDDRGASSNAQVTITVNRRDDPPPNKLPIVDAGDAQTITLPLDSVTLSGTASDSDGNITSTRWSMLPGQGSPQIANASGLSTRVTGLVEGKYQFVLQVRDNRGGQARDTVEIIVQPKVRSVKRTPIVDAGPDLLIKSRTPLPSLQPAIVDPDSMIKSMKWSLMHGPVAEVNAENQVIPGVDSLEDGIYVFELSVLTKNDSVIRDFVSMIVAVPVITKIRGGGGRGDDIPWVPIAVASALALGALTYRFFFWIPWSRKVVVYFMNKAEETIVDSIIPGGEKTRNFSVRNCSRKEIRKLIENNIAVHVLNTNDLVINTHGRIRQYKYSKKEGFKKQAEDSHGTHDNRLVNLVTDYAVKPADNQYPDFYIITLDGPFLPAFQDRVKGLGIEIIQAVPVNSFLLYVRNAQQMADLKGKDFSFIRLILPYSSQDTGLIVRKDHFREAASNAGELILDLVLHRDTDLSAVIDFLDKLAIRVLKSRRNRIRIQVNAASVTDLSLPENKYIQAISEYIPPVLYNDVARYLVGLDREISGVCSLTQTGDGEIIAVADTGIDRDHPDFGGRILDTVSWGRTDTDDTSDPSGHGTHVAGSIAGTGAASGGKIKGVAPGAQLFFQSLMDHHGGLVGAALDLKDLFQQAYDRGARVHNNSWGSTAEARYTIESEEVDEFIYEHPEMLIVFAAGNDGVEDEREDFRGHVGFESIGSPATAKNSLSVGASRNKRTEGGIANQTYGVAFKDHFKFPPTSTELVSGDPESIAAFSSRGKVNDTRMKPDIVAPGTDIISVRSRLAPADHYDGEFSLYNNAYAYLGGTSMAAPLVAGAAALVREYYKKTRGCTRPSAALVKATLINGTRKLTGASANHLSDIIPNPHQGYGMLDLSNTIPGVQHPFLLHFHDSLTNPEANLYANEEGFLSSVRLHTSSWLRVCLAYTDEPARGIQSDLDLMLTHAETNKKWSGNRGIYGYDPTRKNDDDKINNLEIIRLDNAVPGLYTAKVTAFNLLDDKQGFALVITTGDMEAQFV